MLNSLDHILGTTAKVRLLRALLPLDSPASGREAERLAGVSHLSATRALDDLVALGVLDRTVTQATHLYRINREHDLVRPLETLFECESARLTSLREEIQGALTAELAGAITSVGVFGSAARGEAQPDSDLDLLVLVTDRSHAAAATDLLGVLSHRLRERYGARASVLVLTIPEARHRLEDGDPLLREIAHDSRTLFGTRIQEALDVW